MKFLLPAALCAVLASACPVIAADSETIRSLDEAIALALRNSPALRALEARKAASAGDLEQAGLLPNPELTGEIENLAGSGEYRGARSAELTVGVAQRLEMGGKREGRVGLARAEAKVIEAEADLALRDLVRDVTKAYADSMAAGRGREIEIDRVRLADEVLSITRERVKAGKEPLSQARKAEVALATAEMARQRAEGNLRSAELSLTFLVGTESLALVPNRSWYEDLGATPSYLPKVTETPDMAVRNREIVRARAGYDLESAKALPDVTVSAGLRHFRESDDRAFLVGVSIPIPVFDRNQGAKERARHEILRAEAEAEQARQALSSSLTRARQGLELARQEVESLRRNILPGAEEAFAFAREGYQVGRFPLLEVLDAQRTLFDAREQLNKALNEFHQLRADFVRQTGER